MQKELFSAYDFSGDIDVDDAYEIAQIILGNPYERMFNTLLTLDT
jgi:hypothetical protein